MRALQRVCNVQVNIQQLNRAMTNDNRLKMVIDSEHDNAVKIWRAKHKIIGDDGNNRTAASFYFISPKGTKPHFYRETKWWQYIYDNCRHTTERVNNRKKWKQEMLQLQQQEHLRQQEQQQPSTTRRNKRQKQPPPPPQP